MNKPLHQLFLLLVFLSVSLAYISAQGQTPTSTTAVDPEYERYRQRGDELYKGGKYADARAQYQNCLEVPGFESDKYANEQISECTIALKLRQRADEAKQQGKTQVAFDLLTQLLNFNPDDAITKAQLADYYEREGNQLFGEKRYEAAKESYEKALTYTTTRQETLRLQIKNINTVAKPPKRVGLKLFTGAVAVGAGAYAYLLRSDYQTKLDALKQISQTVDPTNSDVIANPDAYRQYNDAYTAAEDAKQKNGLFTACVGVAALATVAELYLLIHKPKVRVRTSTIYWKPASQSYGLAIGYSF